MSLNDAVKAMLYRLELEGEWAGWDWQPPEIFWVDANIDEGKVSYHRAEKLTECIRFLMHRYNGDTRLAMAEMAGISEHVRVMTGAQPGEPSLHEPYEPGWGFYGFALRSEAWSVTTSLMEEVEEWTGRIDQHPRRVETRLINMVSKDGGRWFLTRKRGAEPQMWSSHDGDGDLVSDVVNGLIRMVNAAAGSEVPLRTAP